MKEMQAPCGLDCSTCNLYNAGHDEAAAAALVSWFRARSWIGETEGVEAVRRKAPLCSGGRDWARQPFCGDCYMRGCCEENQLMDCSACPYFPCVYCRGNIGFQIIGFIIILFCQVKITKDMITKTDICEFFRVAFQ